MTWWLRPLDGRADSGGRPVSGSRGVRLTLCPSLRKGKVDGKMTEFEPATRCSIGEMTLPRRFRMHCRNALMLVLVTGPLAWAACGEDPAAPDDEPPEDDPPVVQPDFAAAAATITAADAAERTRALAHDSLRGRQTYRPEIETVARYLADELEGLGLEPAGTDGFMHRFEFEYGVRDDHVVLVQTASGDVVLGDRRDYFLLPSRQEDERDVTGQVFWGGPAASAERDAAAMAGRVVLYDAPVADFDVRLLDPERTAAIATQNDAVALGLVLSPDFTEEEVARAAAVTRTWSRPLPTVFLTEPAAEALLAEAGTDLATLRAGDPRPVDLSVRVRGWRRVETVTPPNVVALLRGSDAELRDEYVVVSAHFDHLGVGIPDITGDSILNGADDNASGTAAVLAIAEAMTTLERSPARSVLFFLTSGEEHGKVGSADFTRNPTVPAGAMVANLNFDIVGRNEPDRIFGSGVQYSSLGGRLKAVAAERSEVGLTVVDDDPDPRKGFYFGSDNAAFVCQDIPALLFISGLHDDYHEVSDEAQRLDPEKIARVAALGFYLTWDVADDPEAPTWTAAGEAMMDDLSCVFGQDRPPR